MTQDTRDVVEYSMPEFIKEVVLLTLDGWVVSPTCPGDALPMCNTFTVSMYRSAETVDKLKTTVEKVGSTPKPTRAEILAKARAAKAAKLDVTTISGDES